MAAILLDTTVLIDLLHGRPAVERLRRLRSQRDVPLVCAINIEEVVRGLRREEEPAAGRLFNGLVLAPLDRAAGELAGAWRRDFSRQGVTLSQADCLVAAAAVGASARLATANVRDFPMQGLAIEHWPAGE